jgi:hypothetical protein
MDAVLIQIGGQASIPWFQISLAGDGCAYAGYEQGIHLFQEDLAGRHRSLLFNLAKTGSNARKTRLLQSNVLLNLRLFEPKQP